MLLKGLNGFVSCAADGMVSGNIVDDGIVGIPGGALTNFIFADNALLLSSKTYEERKQMVADELVKVFGMEEFRTVRLLSLNHSLTIKLRYFLPLADWLRRQGVDQRAVHRGMLHNVLSTWSDVEDGA